MNASEARQILTTAQAQINAAAAAKAAALAVATAAEVNNATALATASVTTILIPLIQTQVTNGNGTIVIPILAYYDSVYASAVTAYLGVWTAALTARKYSYTVSNNIITITI